MHALDDETRRRYAHQGTPQFVNALIEASDVIDIATLDSRAFTASPHALRKLRDLPKGADEMPETGHDPSRDYGFEFTTAAMLQESGVFGGFGRAGDAIQIPGCHPWECKRLGTLEALEDRMRDGRSQLEVAHRQGTSAGIVAFDLTRPLRRAHGTLKANTDAQLLAATRRFVHAEIPTRIFRRGFLDRHRRPCVLGVLLRFVSVGHRGKRDHVRRTTTWQVVELHRPQSVENELFLVATRALGCVVEGRIEELLMAEASVLGRRHLTRPTDSPLSRSIRRALKRVR